MAAVTIPTGASGRSQSWGQKYPPLLAIGVALLIALIVLPSSLNLPQTNPTTTLEYAPVPPSDDDPPPPNNSNLDSLSIAGSSTIEEGATEGGGGLGDLPEPDDLLPNQKTPSTKRCVGNPPRQTEDPLSPPCVASFTGDNFGATYQGVTADEITVLFYFDNGGTLVTSRGAQESPPDPGTYVDLDAPEADDDYIDIRNLRIWLRYFNERFQTYNRRVHGYAYFTAADTAEGRRADASEVTSGRGMPKPFAYIDQATFNGHNAAFLDGMAKRGVMNFGSLQGLANSFYRKYAPLAWGYWPDIERTADSFVTYLCSRVVPYNVSHSGQYNGEKRKLGMIYTSDPGYPGLQLLAQYTKEGVEACGGKIEDTATYPVAGYSVSAGQDPSYANTQMARFSQNDITTIIWAGGQETYFSKAAGTIGYQPEWIVSGDRIMESSFNAQQQDQSVWNFAWTVTNVVKEGRFDDSYEVQAFREAAGPDYPRRDIQYAIDAYKDIFQLYRAIQVAGPRLGPTNIDKGFHAIPKIKSDDPRKPAGYYEPNDYTYVKDAQVMWWDSTAENPYQDEPGCYRMVENGLRYLAGSWGSGDDFASGRAKPNDECNAYDTGINIRTGPA